jgi:hypothetical protein
METEHGRAYSNMALEAILTRGVQSAIEQASHEVIILERLARAAGTTNWYVLHDANQLSDLADRLSPGSSVSFFFDGRLAFHDYNTDVKRTILRIARRDRQAVVAKRSSDEIALKVDFIANESELDDFREDMGRGERILYGAYPAKDNDGALALTIDLPDRDGIVRLHPH